MRREATRPPEARGLSRDAVRLLVATPDGMAHASFSDLPRYLSAGDLLVINTSATLPAAVDGRRGDGRPVGVHVSGTLDDGSWIVELREPLPGAVRVTDAVAGEHISLPGAAYARLGGHYPDAAANRLWVAAASATGPVTEYLGRHGRPIRYSYVPDDWPLSAYQTVFARSPGSAEMPSAGRPFTARLVTDLVAAGVVVAPITLHTGVASLESGEQPLPERFSVPQPTAQLVNLTREAGRRVVAVGTTCTRALESAAGADGLVRGTEGWTDLVLGPQQPARVIGGLITGWHEPGATHLELLEAVAGAPLVRAACRAAEHAGYLWHEFGDSCLLLPHAGAGTGTWRLRGLEAAEEAV